jgi:hypothetical protein
MTFIEWREVFEEIFEDCPDSWTLSRVHRNDRNQLQKLESRRRMTWTAFAQYVRMALLLIQSLNTRGSGLFSANFVNE